MVDLLEQIWLEMEIGITGGEEDGVDNTGTDQNKLYTQPEQVKNNCFNGFRATCGWDTSNEKQRGLKRARSHSEALAPRTMLDFDVSCSSQSKSRAIMPTRRSTEALGTSGFENFGAACHCSLHYLAVSVFGFCFIKFCFGRPVCLLYDNGSDLGSAGDAGIGDPQLQHRRGLR